MRMKRVVKGIAYYDERAFWKIAEKLHRHIHPDIATASAVLSSALAFILYLDVTKNPNNYLWICALVAIHYFCDAIDGKIAKLRCLKRKNGGLIDKVSDCISSVLFISGFFYSATKSVQITAVFLIIYFIIFISYLYYYFAKKVDVIFGGTEGRIGLIVLNLLMWINK